MNESLLAIGSKMNKLVSILLSSLFCVFGCSKSVKNDEVVSTENIESNQIKKEDDTTPTNNLTVLNATVFENIKLIETTDNFNIFENDDYKEGTDGVQYFVFPKLIVGTNSDSESDEKWGDIYFTIYSKGIKGAKVGFQYDWVVYSTNAEESNRLYNEYKDKRAFYMTSIAKHELMSFDELGAGSTTPKIHLNYDSNLFEEFEIDNYQGSNYLKEGLGADNFSPKVLKAINIVENEGDLEKVTYGWELSIKINKHTYIIKRDNLKLSPEVNLKVVNISI